MKSQFALVAVVVALTMVSFLAGGDSAAQSTDPSTDPWSSQQTAGAPDLLAIATDIVTGQILTAQSIDTGQSVYSLYEVAIDETERGTLSSTVFVEVAGGTTSTGDLVLVSHQPFFEVGQQVKLLLVEATAAERADLGVDAYSIVGGMDGVNLLSGGGPMVSQAQALGDFVHHGATIGSFPQTYNLLNGASAAQEASILAGIGTWEVATCSTVDFTFGARSGNSPTTPNDGVNQIGPVIPASAADTWVGLARWSVSLPDEIVTEWDIQLNVRDHSFSPGATSPGSHDFATVLRHEIGHVLGLDHTPARSEIMYEDVPQGIVKQLGAGDVAGVTLLYPAHPFTDVGILTYYEIPVVWMRDVGISEGTTATTFSPSELTTRAEMALFLHRSAGSPAVSGAHSFTDVPAGATYEQAVIWLLQQNITQGTTATTFGPNATVSRAQMAAFLHRLAGEPSAPPTSQFVDVPTGEYYTQPVAWLLQSGITTGTSPTRFSPGDRVTRGQMATFLYRFFGENRTC